MRPARDLITGLERAETARLGAEIAELQMSRLVWLLPLGDLDSLCKLTDSDVDPDLLATRFDADSVRVLPVFAHGAGRAWLDPGRSDPGSGHRREPPQWRGVPGRHRADHPGPRRQLGEPGGGAPGQTRTRQHRGIATRTCATSCSSRTASAWTAPSSPPASAAGSSCWTKPSACA